jgi:hypothetical protein
MASSGGLGMPRVPPRPVTRSQTPKLATRARAAAHLAPQARALALKNTCRGSDEDAECMQREL